jgi:ubiquinone/menaquinone biosynthesis C-methylase UbiE
VIGEKYISDLQRFSKSGLSAEVEGSNYDMSFYSDHILPHVINLAMRNRELHPYRERVLSQAHGRVLEIGIGSGLNLPLYGPRVDTILGLDPAARLLRMAQDAANRSKIPVTLITGSAQAMPVDSGSIDTLVTTWTLCSIPDAGAALQEMRRVLTPSGQLLFVEHGSAPEEGVRKWQDRLTPVWKKVGGGCHLNRPIRALIESAGFKMIRLDAGYARGPRPLAYFYEGCAAPR